MTSIKTETIIRTLVLLMALVNQILAIAGKDMLPIYESDVVQFVSLYATLASTLWAWWKNNSFTEEAIQADAYLEQLRSEDDEE